MRPSGYPISVNWLRRNWPVLAFLFVLPIFPLWRAIFAGEAIGAFDQVAPMGWAPNAPKSPMPWDVLQADSVLQFYVWRDLVFHAWGRGEIPFWNPYELCGTPLLANSQSAVLYPPHILMGVLHIPTTVAMLLLAWSHLFFAGVGMYALSRRMGASVVGATVGAGAFSVSAFMVSWTALPSVISTVAWIPWALFFAHSCILSDRKVYRPVIGLAGSIGFMILAGHLQFVAYGMIALLTFVGVLSIRTRSGLGVAKVFIAMALGFSLAAPQLLPALSFSQFSHRRNTPSEDGYAAYAAGAVQPFEMVGLAFPEVVGNPQQFLGDDPKTELSGYWPMFFKRGGNFAEGAIGIGAVALLGLGFLGRKKIDWRALAPIVAVAVIGFLLASGSVINRLLYFFVPGWSATGSPGRAEVLFVMAVCVLAAIGFSQVAEELPTEKWKPYVPIFVLTVALALSFFSLQSLSLNPISGIKPDFAANVFSIASSSAKISALIKFLVVAAIGSYMIYDRQRKPWLWAFAMVAIAIPPVGFTVRTSPPLPPFVVEHDAHKRVAIVNSSWDIIQPGKAFLPPNLASLLGVMEVGGYDSLIHRDTVALIKEIDGQDAAPPANGNMMFVKPKFDLQKLHDAGVSEVWQTNPSNGETMRTPVGGSRVIEASAHSNRSQKQPEITAETNSSVVVSGSSSFVLLDRNMPGWTASIENKPIELKGTTWRQVDLPDGSPTVNVVFRYLPPGFDKGCILAIVSMLVLVGIGWWKPKSNVASSEDGSQ